MKLSFHFTFCIFPMLSNSSLCFGLKLLSCNMKLNILDRERCVSQQFVAAKKGMKGLLNSCYWCELFWRLYGWLFQWTLAGISNLLMMKKTSKHHYILQTGSKADHLVIKTKEIKLQVIILEWPIMRLSELSSLSQMVRSQFHSEWKNLPQIISRWNFSEPAFSSLVTTSVESFLSIMYTAIVDCSGKFNSGQLHQDLLGRLKQNKTKTEFPNLTASSTGMRPENFYVKTLSGSF